VAWETRHPLPLPSHRPAAVVACAGGRAVYVAVVVVVDVLGDSRLPPRSPPLSPLHPLARCPRLTVEGTW
jgi:hypothetical protein